MPRFAHLHLHSEYSLADSTIRIPELVARCVALGQPAVAVTDRNNLFALVKFYRAAEAKGIKPVAGADVFIAEGDEAPSRLTLLCRDHAGYLTLSRLLTQAWMEGQRHDGVVLRPQWLAANNGGLFALAGRNAQVGQLAGGGRHDLAEQALADLQRQFGDRLHLELTRCGLDGEQAFNDFALHASGKLGIPVVASNDVRFLAPEGFDAHEARVCIASGRVLDDPRRPHDYGNQQYLKSSDEMAALFDDVPDAIDNALALAQRCNLELRLGTYYLPAFPVPSDHTLDSWIRSEARDGLSRRLETQPLADGHDRASYAARLETELDVIIKMGFPGYFLIVADFINWAKDHGIPVGPGRGSGAGSLVAWALGITDLDPLPYDLLFERFLNPERVSMPDFDIDFCMDRRDEVIDYVAAKYGRDRVSQIITYGTMAAKAVVRDTGRVLGFPYGFVDGIAKLIPLTLGICLDDALGRSEAAQKNSELASSELIARYNDEDDVRDLLDLALQLEDLTRNAGKHAGGVVIAPTPLSDFCPLFAEHDGDGHGRNPVTQFDKDDVEAVGLVKFDFLGLRTLTIIDWAVKAINRRPSGSGEDAGQRKPLDISTIPLDDARTYELFARGDTVAVFQFESRGMRELLKRAQPDRFEDLIALNSLFRPGPMDLIPDFVERKHGRAQVQYPHPLLESVLAPTYGVVVYQEQVMQTAQILAGYSLGGADLLRRAMGKKKPEEMAKQRSVFIDGATQRGVEQSNAAHIFDLMEKFAGYGFNKSHSAAYALLSYQTAWLKAHYPAAFMSAVLSSDMDKTDKVVTLIDEARRMRLKVEPPDVNHSQYMFTVSGERSIRYGLGAIKGVGQSVVEMLVAERQANGAYCDLSDLCRRSDQGKLNRRVLEALIRSGAADSLGANRATLMHSLPTAMQLADQTIKARAVGQNDMFGLMDPEPMAPVGMANEALPDWSRRVRLDGERDTLGLYLTGHPFEEFEEEVKPIISGRIADVTGDRPVVVNEGFQFRGKPATIAGMVFDVGKRGSRIIFTMDDRSGRLEASMFEDVYQQYRSQIAKSAILIVEGSLRFDEFIEGWRLNAKRVIDIDQAREQHARRLVLRWPADAGPDFVRTLEQILKPFRGGRCAVAIRYYGSGAKADLVLSEEWAVKPARELTERLAQLVGHDGMRLIYAPRFDG
jgi:DNA polymerase-3 subunit alpha